MSENKHSDNDKEPCDNLDKKECIPEPKTVTLSEEEYLALKGDAQKAREYWDTILRLQADFENVRKRQEKSRQDFTRFANEGIILELLIVLDDLERTVALAQQHQQEFGAFLKGVEMILAHLYELLKKYGVKAIECEGKIFDPNFHEALMQVENKDVPEHTIIEEMQKGYMLHDRVIRTAKVSVSRKPAG